MTLQEKMTQLFIDKFGGQPGLVEGHGRVNIIGEHTDYNRGFVLPAAIDKRLIFAFAENGRQECRFWADDIGESAHVDLAAIRPTAQLWVNYLAGILEQFQKRGANLPGLDVVFGGNLPVGAGVSSSAALETGFATVLNTITGLQLSGPELARLAQQSSHTFVGIPCGIMDQFASLMGRKDQVILLDCRNLDYRYIPFALGSYQLVLINSKVSHSLASSAYADRVRECRRGVEILQKYDPDIASLRDAGLEQIKDHRKEMGEVIYQRCSYVAAENVRVLAACECMKAGDMPALGALLNETHAGLRDKYEVSCEEVDFLVGFAQQYEGVAGSRIMGGGFGGCSLNLVKVERAAGFITAVKAAYRERFGILADDIQVMPTDGTRLVG